jgi:hypothetical protein
MLSRTLSGPAAPALLAAVGLLLTTAGPAAAAERPLAARNVEVLRGTVKAVAHRASGRASVIATGRRRALNLRSFRIDPGPRVRVYLVPRGARSDGAIPRDFKDIGALKGSRGNQRYEIPASVDLRKYTSVVFWCVPFTQSLARADLRRA